MSSNNNTNKKTIYIQEYNQDFNVLRIKTNDGSLIPNGARNIGSLCHGRHDGKVHLDFSRPSIDYIQRNGGDFLSLSTNPPDRAIRVGSGPQGQNNAACLSHIGGSACWGGAIYVSWREYTNIEDAIAYLKRYFNVGRILRSNGPLKKPLLVAPDLPCLNGADPATAGQLIDDWFRQMQDVLRDLKKRFGGVDVFFEGGGTVPIPDWFRDWCAQEGINITVGDGPPCDLDIQTNNNDRKFVEFWQAIKNLGPEGGVCPSQGRGATVKYRIENDRLILISEGRNPNAMPMRTTKHRAEEWFNKLQGGMNPFGNGGFRYNHSAWFHDVYVAILAI